MKNALECAYQPIFDLAADRVSHYEALLRLRHDPQERGHLPLIQLAERYRFIATLDLAMWERVLQDLSRHAAPVALNVSPYSIEQAGAALRGLLTVYRDRLPRLIVEITETMPITDAACIEAFIAFVRHGGGRVALDDFGNGRGCFTEPLVARLRPDFLKLDGEVIARALFFQDDRELLTACELAARCGSAIIAEYIDTPEKIAFLRRMQIRYAQGRAYGMPQRQLPSAAPPVLAARQLSGESR